MEAVDRCELAVNMTVNCLASASAGTPLSSLAQACGGAAVAVESLCVNNTARFPWPLAAYRAFTSLMPSLTGTSLEAAVQNL